MTADNALIRAAQQGDAEAFEMLISEHYEQIYRFAFRWAGEQSEAEDITQQACIKLANSLSQFRFESAFSTWLYRLVINCAKDWFKSQNRHRHMDEADLPAIEDTRSSQAEDQLHLQRALHEIDQLGDGMKDAVVLVLGEGLTHKEAGDILGVKESTVSWRIHEVRKHMRGWPPETPTGTNKDSNIRRQA